MKAVLQGKFIAVSACVKKKTKTKTERTQVNDETMLLKYLKKQGEIVSKPSHHQELTKVRAENNKIEAQTKPI